MTIWTSAKIAISILALLTSHPAVVFATQHRVYRYRHILPCNSYVREPGVEALRTRTRSKAKRRISFELEPFLKYVYIRAIFTNLIPKVCSWRCGRMWLNSSVAIQSNLQLVCKSSNLHQQLPPHSPPPSPPHLAASTQPQPPPPHPRAPLSPSPPSPLSRAPSTYPSPPQL